MRASRTKTILALFIAAALAGCAVNPRDIGREPHLTPVGSGLQPDKVPILNEPVPVPTYRKGNSIWQDGSAALFRDPRAAKIGDVVTVRISINDRAQLDNNSERSRESRRDLNANLTYNANTGFARGSGDAALATSFDGNTETDSRGAISRRENIDLRVGAVVTDVLPNGNLVISGTQEVRVNFEVRVLSVAGVVRPIDISTENSIAYDRVAEARISYGGRGRITEVQQPALGHQLFDIFSPF